MTAQGYGMTHTNGRHMVTDRPEWGYDDPLIDNEDNEPLLRERDPGEDVRMAPQPHPDLDPSRSLMSPLRHRGDAMSEPGIQFGPDPPSKIHPYVYEQMVKGDFVKLDFVEEETFGVKASEVATKLEVPRYEFGDTDSGIMREGDKLTLVAGGARRYEADDFASGKVEFREATT